MHRFILGLGVACRVGHGLACLTCLCHVVDVDSPPVRQSVLFVVTPVFFCSVHVVGFPASLVVVQYRSLHVILLVLFLFLQLLCTEV